MRFSVVIPVYNRADSIAEAVASVLNQTILAHEVIVVDDGSTDNIEAALLPFRNSIQLIRRENAGVAAARNTAVAAATGDWIAFQDSDDIWTPTHMESVIRDLHSADSTVICHIGDVDYSGLGYSESLFGIKKRKFPKGTAIKIDDPLPLVITGMTLQGATIRRDVFNEIGGFDEEMKMLSDTAFFCRLALKGPFLVTGDKMANIRRLPEDRKSITSINKRNVQYAREMNVRIYELLLSESMARKHRKLVRRMLSGAEFQLSRILLSTDAKESRNILWRSARRHPNKFSGWAKAAIAFFMGDRGFELVLNRHRSLDRS